MKLNFSMITSVAILAYLVGSTVSSVGQSYEGGVFSSWMPVKVVGSFALAMVMAFFAGRDSK